MPSENYVVHEIAFYRRSLDGWSYTSNRLFCYEHSARKLLRSMGYRLLEGEENLYHNRDMRATLVERTIE